MSSPVYRVSNAGVDYVMPVNGCAGYRAYSAFPPFPVCCKV